MLRFPRDPFLVLLMAGHACAFHLGPAPKITGQSPLLAAPCTRLAQADLVASASNPGVGGSAKLGALAYSLYAIGFGALLIKTLRAFPLIPPSINSLLWCRSWLWTTIVDYYGAALALCGVIIATEDQLIGQIGWCFGCLFLGTPFCCMWVARMLLKRGSLRIGS